jgi:hypothetical protein
VSVGIPEPTPAEYIYWACDLKTGNKLEPLPLKPSGKLPNHIGQLSTASFTIDLSELRHDDGTPPVDFWSVTIPGRSFIACEALYDGGASSDIVWAGIILLRSGGSGADAGLSCATAEAFLSRRSILTNHIYSETVPTDTDAKIMADLLADAAVEGINLVVDVQGSTTRTLRYKAKEYTKVLAAVQDLADLEGGPEWIIVPAWKTADRLAIGFTFYARPRLGSSGTPPNARFDFPGCITDYDTTDDFTEQAGGNAITPRADSGTAAGVVARDEAGLAAGWPRWEQEVSKPGVKTAAGLDGLGRATLALNARGHTTHVMTVDATLGPKYLRDLQLGDDVSFIVYGPESPNVAPPSYRHPDGLTQTVRIMGIELDPNSDTYDPVLWSPYDGGQ